MTLDQLVVHLTQLLAPTLEDSYSYAPLDARYEDLRTKINDGEVPAEVRKKIDSYYQISESSVRWTELSLTEGSPSELVAWKQLTLEERAELIAYKRLANMYKTLEMFEVHMENHKKAQKGKNKSQNKPKRRRR